MLPALNYKRRLLPRTCGRRERSLAIVSVIKPPLRAACIRRTKRALPTGDLVFLVSF
jgi:hypothetical protein